MPDCCTEDGGSGRCTLLNWSAKAKLAKLLELAEGGLNTCLPRLPRPCQRRHSDIAPHTSQPKEQWLFAMEVPVALGLQSEANTCEAKDRELTQRLALFLFGVLAFGQFLPPNYSESYSTCGVRRR